MSDNAEEHEMIHRAVFGKQVEAFMNSDIGRYMVARANEQRISAQSAFLSVDPFDSHAVLEVQNKIIVADSIIGWLADAVGDGIQALGILEDRN